MHEARTDVPQRWLAAFVVAVLSSCSAEVRIPPGDDGGDPEGGSTSSSTLPSGGESSSPSTGGSTSSGSGGSPPDTDAETLVKEQCPIVAAESHFCVTLGYPSTLYAIGADSGDTCYLGEVDSVESIDVSSLAVVGSSVHGCSYGVGLWRAPLLGGTADVLPVDCRALTDYGGGFLLAEQASPDLVFHYPDFESMGMGGALEAITVDPQFSRIATQGETLFTAWHSTDTVQVEDLPSSTELPSLLLEGFDDWVDGISVTSDGKLFVLSSETLFGFESATGAQLTATGIDTSLTTLSALYCWAN